MTARLGSLCSGAGMLDLAVGSLLDVRHVWHAETDEAAAKVLAAHWPDVPNLADITAVEWTPAEPVDVLCAGFPCQGFSMAGKRQGSADERHLWPTGVLPAIGALMPPLVVLENVPGLLTIEGGQVFGRVLADLDELGYTVSWTTVGACRVGACHHRHRIFLAANLAEVEAPSGEPLARRDGAGWVPVQDVLFGDAEAVKWPPSGMTWAGLVWPLPVQTCGADGQVVLPTPTATPYGNNQSPAPGAAVRPSLEGVVQMLPTPTARLGDDRRGAPSAEVAGRRMESGRRNLDDAVALLPTPRASDTGTEGRRAGEGWRPPLSQVLLPTPTARDATRGAGWGDQPGRPLSEVIALLPTPTASDGVAGPGHAATAQGSPDLRTAVSMLPTPRATDATKGGPNQRGSAGDLMLPAAVQPGRFGVYEAAARRQEQAFGLPAPDPTEPGRLGKPRLSAAFPEWMVGLPAGWITAHVGRSDAIRIAGNGVVWQAAAYALATLPTFRAAEVALNREAVRAA